MRRIKHLLALTMIISVLLGMPLKTQAMTYNNGFNSFGGIDLSAVYDFDYYRSNNPDLFLAFGYDAYAYLRHFVTVGMSEGRRGCEDFDVYSYKRAYGDLRAKFGNDLRLYYLQYASTGKAEGRNLTKDVYQLMNPITSYMGYDLSSIYDYTYYVTRNADVRAVFGDDDIAVIKHFMSCGLAEGRLGKPLYNQGVYNYYRALFTKNAAIVVR